MNTLIYAQQQMQQLELDEAKHCEVFHPSANDSRDNLDTCPECVTLLTLINRARNVVAFEIRSEQRIAEFRRLTSGK